MRKEPHFSISIMDKKSIVGREKDSSFENVPDWFAAAQRKAKRTSTDTGEIQRSRYAEAMDAAEREREARRLEREREEEEAAAASAAQAIQDALAESAELPWEAEGDALAAEVDEPPPLTFVRLSVIFGFGKSTSSPFAFVVFPFRTSLAV